MNSNTDKPPIDSDWKALELAVKSIACITLATVLGSILLIATGKPVPEGIIALGSAGVGGLATMLNAGIKRG